MSWTPVGDAIHTMTPGRGAGITDRVPALKRRMAMGMQKVRDSELESA